MDYSRYTFNQLTEALEAMDKKAYPDNYKALSSAIQNYPTDKLQTEAFIDEVSPMGVSQLKIKLADTDNPSHRAILHSLITFKSNRFTKIKFWFTWITVGLVLLIGSSFAPKAYKSIASIVGLSSFILCIVIAAVKHRKFNRKIRDATEAQKNT